MFKTKMIKLSDIRISDDFARSKVSEDKLAKCRKFYNDFGEPDRQIILSSDGVLIDGYVMYLVYKEHEKEEITVQVRTDDYRINPMVYVYGKHINGKDKIYVWRVPQNWTRFKENIKAGDMILCRTKYGIQPVLVTDVQMHDICPVNFKVRRVASQVIFKKCIEVDGEYYYDNKNYEIVGYKDFGCVCKNSCI